MFQSVKHGRINTFIRVIREIIRFPYSVPLTRINRINAFRLYPGIRSAGTRAFGWAK